MRRTTWAAALAAICAAALAADVSVSTVSGDDITGETRVVTGVSVAETDPTVPAWAKGAEPPRADFSTNNVQLVGSVAKTITNEVTKSYVEGLGISGGVPGNYAVVSNAAMNAVTTNANRTVIIETGNVVRPDSIAIGSFAHGELVVVNNGKGVYAGGVNVGALGDGAHAEGIGSQAYEEGAHAEGYNAKAYGYEAHAEGGFTRADGEASHAEGFHSSASGDAAHAAGVRATATNHASFVWQGTAVDASRYSTIPLYGSHGPGTFNVNPVGGASGFWIGNQTVGQLMSSATNGVFRCDKIAGGDYYYGTLWKDGFYTVNLGFDFVAYSADYILPKAQRGGEKIYLASTNYVDAAIDRLASTNYVDAAISTNNPAFVSAVLAAPLAGADADDIAEIAEYGGYGTVGAAILALIAGLAALKRRVASTETALAQKADAADLRYALVEAEPTGNGSYALSDRASNVLTPAPASAATLTLPPAVAGRVRDLIVRIDLADAATAPEVTFYVDAGEPATFETEDGAMPELEAGKVNLISFTETVAGRFAVAHKTVEEVS